MNQYCYQLLSPIDSSQLLFFIDCYRLILIIGLSIGCAWYTPLQSMLMAIIITTRDSTCYAALDLSHFYVEDTCTCILVLILLIPQQLSTIATSKRLRKGIKG